MGHIGCCGGGVGSGMVEAVGCWKVAVRGDWRWLPEFVTWWKWVVRRSQAGLKVQGLEVSGVGDSLCEFQV